MTDQHIEQYFKQVGSIVDQIDKQKIAALVAGLVELRTGGGRLFLLGVVRWRVGFQRTKFPEVIDSVRGISCAPANP